MADETENKPAGITPQGSTQTQDTSNNGPENKPAGITPQGSTQTQDTSNNGLEDVSEESQYAEGGEGDSVLLDDEAYVGVAEEYRNAAYPKNAPQRSEDDDRAEAEEVAKDAEIVTAMRGQNVGFRGYEAATPHPTEAVNKADAAAKNRNR